MPITRVKGTPMKTPFAVVSNCFILVLPLALSQAPVASGGEPWITLYNQDFAVVRVKIPLALEAGESRITTTDLTAHLEPDSVILRDPAGRHGFSILEQNYRNDPVSQELMLRMFEGKSIDFLVPRADGPPVVEKVLIVRSGYEPHAAAFSRYGNDYYQLQMATAQASTPIVSMNGQIRFGLPGQPLFPALSDDTVLKPRIEWVIASPEKAAFDAELAYVTGGFTWNADYNVIAPEQGDVADVLGWVTMDNESGTTFENARIKLMAGDVNKIDPSRGNYSTLALRESRDASGMQAPVSEKAFDEFHLYTLARPTTLHDRETKQVEFVRATGVKSTRYFVYDGASIDSNRYGGWDPFTIRENAEYGTQSNKKVFSMLEVANTEANRLGMPLPKGRVRFYRRDDDGRLEFVGENTIDHTPKDEVVRVYTGNSFDLVGDRTRVDFIVDSSRRMLDESFHLVLKNHKKDAVEIRVVEHLYRWSNWQITKKSDDFTKTNSQTIEFRVKVPADGEKAIDYTAHYSW